MADEPRSVDPEATTQRVAPSPGIASGRIGRYRLRRIIATGGMGTVYEAIQENPRRLVALKVMKHGVASRAAMRRFEHEAAILARLRHPCIAQVFEAGMHDDGFGATPFFAMEFVPGASTLTQYAAIHRLGVRERLELFARICEAVAHGHAKGVVHRDLKPDNILVDAHGDPKVIDFGVARTTEHDLSVTTIFTQPGELIGTLQYMSPEQVGNDPRAIDERTDVYALGVVLYELLTDELPYHLDQVPLDEAVRIVREKPPPRLSSHGTAVQRELQTIVRTALHKDPDRRYASAGDLAADIRLWLEGQPIGARRDSAAYVLGVKTRRAITRHPVGMGLFTVVLITLLVELLGVPLVYQWTGLNRAYVAAMASLGSDRAWPAALPDVRVVRITDETLAQAQTLASEHDLGPVPLMPGQPPIAMRRLHRALMERLAAAEIKVLCYDFTFRLGPTPFDADFVRGVEALQRVGIPVVVSDAVWLLHAQDSTQTVATIGPSVRAGVTTASWDPERFWSLCLAAQRQPGPLVSSLTIEALAAGTRPDAEIRLDLVDNGHTLLIGLFEGENVVAGADAMLEHRVPLTRLFYESYPHEVDGLVRGDTVAEFWYELPPDEVLDASAVDYEWVLRASDPQLKATLGGTIVLVGNFMAASPPRPAAGGRMVRPSYGYAAGLQQVIDRAPVRIETRIVALAVVLLAVIAGTIIAAATRRRPLIRGVLLVAAAGLVIGGCVACFLRWRFLVDPTVPTLGLLVSFAVIVAVTRLRTIRST